MTEAERGPTHADSPVRPGSILRAMQGKAGDSPRANLPSLDDAAPSAPNTATATHADPALEVVRVEGRVQKIVATCGCGERIVIHCDYDPSVEKQTP